MLNRPLVSVLMTSYNRELYIRVAIESVLAQTYDHFELIILDDGSTDRTVAVAKEYEYKDARVRVYQNEKNLGDYPNRNKAAYYAKGKYIKYVDADDYFYPWGLEIMVQSMEEFPEAGWGLCSLEQDRDKPFPFMLFPHEIYQYHLFRSSLFHKAPLSAIIKRDVFESVDGFSGKRQMSDTEMWHILGMKYSLVLMPHGIVWYREHNQQESAQIRSDIRVRIRYTVAKLHFFKDEDGIPISDSDRKNMILTLRIQLLKSVLVNLFKLRWKDSFRVIQCWRDHSYDFKSLK